MGPKQKSLLFKEDRKILKPSYPVVDIVVSDINTTAAWFRWREYLVTFKGKTSFLLPIDERSCRPISPYQLLDEDEITRRTNQDAIAKSAGDYSDSQSDKQSKKTRYYDFLGFGVMGVVFVLILLIILYAAGKIDFSNFGGAA